MIMAQVVNLNLSRSYFYSPCPSRQPKLNTNNNATFLCLFSHNNNNKQEQARKALESALSGKKDEYDKWDKEIKRKEELGGGGGGGGGTGGGGWFGWSNDDHFWQEAKRACLTILGIILMYLLLAKSNLLLAIIFNPLLYVLRGVRNGFALITSKLFKSTATFDGFSKKEDYQHTSAKDNVIRKWGSD
ncbi:PREDICTED: uncharacterized protein LOC109362900 [Lupinus angustifolius]|uniref:uncharacterized protein LOC109362900 n=1 Tax=Lupinus angustifolius TaxID=3871 RepID=UPI00092F3A01|nr:PREDICTED: uncharacterized protein LOC109362900 [Lupinus angustifolius]